MAAFRVSTVPDGRIPVDEERTDARAKKVIGTARAETAQRLRPARAGERQRLVGVGEMSDDAAVRRHRAAQRRQNACGHVAAVVERLVRERRRTPPRRGYRGRAGTMLVDELAHLIDRADAVQVALALCGAPCEQPVAAEDESVGARVVPDRCLDEQRELEARPLPRHPDDAAAELAG